MITGGYSRSSDVLATDQKSLYRKPNQIDEETSVRTIQSLARERITGDLSDLPQAISAYRRSKGQPTLGEMTLVELGTDGNGPYRAQRQRQRRQR